MRTPLKTIESAATSWNIVRQIRIQTYKTPKKGKEVDQQQEVEFRSLRTLNKSDRAQIEQLRTTTGICARVTIVKKINGQSRNGRENESVCVSIFSETSSGGFWCDL